MATSDAALLEEISRLSGAIQRQKTTVQQPPPPASRGRGRGRGRGGPPRPAYQQPHRSAKQTFTDYVPNQRPGVAPAATAAAKPISTGLAKEVIIDGVAFQSNGKTLVRRIDQIPSVSSTTVMTGSSSTTAETFSTPVLPNTASTSNSLKPPPAGLPTVNIGGQSLVKTRNGLIAADRFKPSTAPNMQLKPPSRTFKPGVVTGFSKRAQPGRNLTLNKTGKPVKQRPKKQCKHFTRTGMCTRGGTCPFEHDPQKIALCPLYLAEKCPFKDRPELCALSHNSTPERTPICTRFNASGDCYKGSDCPYPHVRVGPKTGICRDFAVLGYCDKGAMCEASHLRECPDFAETGECKKMHLKGPAGCKLPHVIRANQQKIEIVKKKPFTSDIATTTGGGVKRKLDVALGDPGVAAGPMTDDVDGKKRKTSPELDAMETDASGRPEDSNEFISLTFMESDEEENDDDEADDEQGADDEEHGVAHVQLESAEEDKPGDETSTDAADEDEVIGDLVDDEETDADTSDVAF